MLIEETEEVIDELEELIEEEIEAIEERMEELQELIEEVREIGGEIAELKVKAESLLKEAIKMNATKAIDHLKRALEIIGYVTDNLDRARELFKAGKYERAKLILEKLRLI